MDKYSRTDSPYYIFSVATNFIQQKNIPCSELRLVQKYCLHLHCWNNVARAH